MKNGVIALVIVAAVFGSDFCHPASAQSALGGPQKHNALGGAMKQTSPVLPMNKGGSVSISPPSPRPPPPPPPPPFPGGLISPTIVVPSVEAAVAEPVT